MLERRLTWQLEQVGSQRPKGYKMAYVNLPNAFPAFEKSKLSPKSNPNSKTKLIKAGKNGNLIVLILDESGSMASITKDTIEGVNGLLQSQREDDIKSHIKIVTFEGGHIRTIRDSSIESVENLTHKDYSPAGGTNLLDAIGQTVLEVDAYLRKFKSDRRPSVIFQITTDGEENQSKTYTLPQTKELISGATEANWLVSFIGAGIDSFKASASLGIAAAATSNYTHDTTGGTFRAMSSSMSRTKHFFDNGSSVQELHATNMVYSDDERETMMKDKK
jgi:uncharacterized protein YegL